MIPELPAANYDVWVRGYGLVDSPKKRGRPGTTMNHTAVVAPNPKAAAEYYPAGYWFSLMKVPAESEFPGTGPEGNGINPMFKSQADFVRVIKNGACLGYYTWIDQFNTLGLGANVPINTGNQSEGLLVLKDGKWVVLRVPYPMGFYTKWLDGRIDDPNAGWKGRGLWATISTRAPFHMEGGKANTSKASHFQLRPDPLAR